MRNCFFMGHQLSDVEIRDEIHYLCENILKGWEMEIFDLSMNFILFYLSEYLIKGWKLEFNLYQFYSIKF